MTLLVPPTPDVTFGGFTEATLAVLERLRENPHIEQYRKEKPAIEAHLMQPFRQLRDDLVVNIVLPNRLLFETERNVFSRLLKNDFGAGGCHHHLWMSFYRPGYRRITDVQLASSLSPDGYSMGVFVAAHMKAVFRTARTRVQQTPGEFLAVLNPLLGTRRFIWTQGSGAKRVRHTVEGPLAGLPDGFGKASGFWVRRLWPRADVLRLGPALLHQTLEEWQALWPLYGFLAEADPTVA